MLPGFGKRNLPFLCCYHFPTVILILQHILNKQPLRVNVSLDGNELVFSPNQLQLCKLFFRVNLEPRFTVGIGTVLRKLVGHWAKSKKLFLTGCLRTIFS